MSTARLHHDHRNLLFIFGMNGPNTAMLLDDTGEHLQLCGYTLETLSIPGHLINASKYGDLNDDTNLSSEIMPNKRNRSVLEELGYAEKIERTAREELSAIAGEDLSAHGCECEYPDSEARVNRLDKLAWHWKDATSCLAHLIKAKAGSRPHLAWSLFWSPIKATAKARTIKR